MSWLNIAQKMGFDEFKSHFYYKFRFVKEKDRETAIKNAYEFGRNNNKKQNKRSRKNTDKMGVDKSIDEPVVLSPDNDTESDI